MPDRKKLQNPESQVTAMNEQIQALNNSLTSKENELKTFQSKFTQKCDENHTLQLSLASKD